MAIVFGLASPILISISMTLAKYYTMHHNYASLDFTVDNYMMMGLMEIYFFIHEQTTNGYATYVLLFGVMAALCNTIGTLAINYAATKGLAGPASAMV